MILPPSLLQTMILFMLMAIGFAAGRSKIIDEVGTKSISRLLVNFVLPALIVQSMQRPFSSELRNEAFAVLGISFLSYAVAFPLAWLHARILKLDGADFGAHEFGAIFSNCAFMGFPVIEAILGKDAIFAASVANIPFQLLAFSVGPHLLARSAHGTIRLRASSFVTPAAVASVIGFALFIGGISLPAPLSRMLSFLGDTTTPLSMILIGSIISRMDMHSVLNRPKVYITSLYRLVAFPAGIFLALYLFGFRGILLSLPVIIAAMPVAANSAILAEAYGGDSKTASSLVFVSTLLSIFTIPILAYLCVPA
jgi:malate permease and related proteins